MNVQTPIDPTFPYEWPGSLSALDPYLPGIAAGRNGVGQFYDIIPPPAPVMRTTPIKIKTDMLTAQRAEDVARLFPLNGKNRSVGYAAAAGELGGRDCAGPGTRGRA